MITNRLHSAIFGMLTGAPVVILNDGGSKTLAAAARFDLLVGPATTPFDDALLADLATAVASRVFPDRDAALEIAKADATMNFTLLASKTGGLNNADTPGGWL